MKFGYIGMPDLRKNRRNLVKLAEKLDFRFVYLPRTGPDKIPRLDQDSSLSLVLDASAFGDVPPSQLEADVRKANGFLDGRLCLGLQTCDAQASPRNKAAAQAMETLFSYDPRPGQATQSRYPMKPPRPKILCLPTSGHSADSAAAAARGYDPLTPSWLPETEVARHWPAIVQGATAALRPARPSQWHIARAVVVHDDPATLESYAYGPNSPFRQYYAHLAAHGLLQGDLDKLMRRLVIAGDGTKVADDLSALHEAVGAFGTLHIIDPAGSDPNMTRNTIIKLTEDVMPQIETSNTPALKTLETT